MVDCFLNDISIQVLVDTGSSRNIIAQKDIDMLNIHSNEGDVVVLELSNGAKVVTLGADYNVRVELEGSAVSAEFQIFETLENDSPLVLGLPLLTALRATLHCVSNRLSLPDASTLDAYIIFDHLYTTLRCGGISKLLPSSVAVISGMQGENDVGPRSMKKEVALDDDKEERIIE